MKRVTGSLILVLILIFLTSCNYSNNITTVRNGTYILKQTGTEAFLSPQVTIFDDNISFTYDLLSSYFPVGVYTIEENVLTMVTNDGLYKYVFEIDGTTLIFKKDKSSKVKLTDDRMGIKIADNAVFKLK